MPIRPVLLLLILNSLVTGVASAADADVVAIRQARVAMNKAIDSHDLEALRTFINQHTTEEVVVNAPIWRVVGHDQYFARYKQLIDSRPEEKWDHETGSVTVSDEYNWASERGTLTQSWRDPDGPGVWKGEYLTLWKRFDGQWYIDAETFVPVKCSGGKACAPAPARHAERPAATR